MNHGAPPELEAVRPTRLDGFGRTALRIWSLFELILAESDVVLSALDPFDPVADKIIKSISRKAEEQKTKRDQ